MTHTDTIHRRLATLSCVSEYVGPGHYDPGVSALTPVWEHAWLRCECPDEAAAIWRRAVWCEHYTDEDEYADDAENTPPILGAMTARELGAFAAIVGRSPTEAEADFVLPWITAYGACPRVARLMAMREPRPSAYIQYPRPELPF